MIYRVLYVWPVFVLSVTGQLSTFGSEGDVYLRHNSFITMECTKVPYGISLDQNGNLFPVYNLTVFRSRYLSNPFVLNFNSLTSMNPSQMINDLINLIRSCYPEQFQRTNEVMETKIYPLKQVTVKNVLKKKGIMDSYINVNDESRFIYANSLIDSPSGSTCLKYIENIPSNVYSKLVPVFTMTAYSSSDLPDGHVFKLTSYKATVQPSNINTLLASLIRSCYGVNRHKRANSITDTWMRSSTTTTNGVMPYGSAFGMQTPGMGSVGGMGSMGSASGLNYLLYGSRY